MDGNALAGDRMDRNDLEGTKWAIRETSARAELSLKHAWLLYIWENSSRGILGTDAEQAWHRVHGIMICLASSTLGYSEHTLKRAKSLSFYHIIEIDFEEIETRDLKEIEMSLGISYRKKKKAPTNGEFVSQREIPQGSSGNTLLAD